MTDAGRLQALLEDYSHALAGHATVVREEFDALHRAYVGLDEVYAGSGAEAFGEVFRLTADRMRRYEEDASALLALLTERLDHLRRFAATDEA